MVFIDETGSNLAMAREYARAPKGKRALDVRPVDRGRVQTVIGALTLDGLEAVMTFEGWLNNVVFETFVRELLVPVLLPGDVVLLDRHGAHKVKRIWSLIEAVGAKVVLLPRAMPYLNPIENCWSKLKNLLKTAAPRTSAALVEAICDAITHITEQDAQGWFEGCGWV